MSEAVRAVVLAAGRGTRLRPHTDDRPKCMLPFAGRRLIDWQLSALRANGVSDVALVGGYRAEALAPLGLPLWENPRWSETNMVHTLFCARPVLESGDSVVVSYGDIVYEPRVVEALLGTAGDIVVVVDRNWLPLWRTRAEDPLDDAESLRIDGTGRLRDIGRKVSTLGEIEAQYIGLMRFTPAGARKLAEFHARAGDGADWLIGRTLDTCYMTDLLRGMIEAGHDLHAATIEGGWLEFDTSSDLAAYEGLRERNALDPFFRIDAFA